MVGDWLVAGCLTQFLEQIQNLTPKTKNFDLSLNNKLKQDDEDPSDCHQVL